MQLYLVHFLPYLKGHGHEADLLGFLQKLVLHRSLTLPFEWFQFWLRIRGDNCNWNDSPTRRVGKSATLWLVSQGVADSPTRRVGESGNRWLLSQRVCFWMFKRKLASRRVGDSPTRRVGESFFNYENLSEFEAKIRTACKGLMPNRFMQKPQKIHLIAMSLQDLQSVPIFHNM